MQTSPNTKFKYNFLKYQYVWLAISVAYFLLGAAAYVYRGGLSYHIEFTGGAEIRLTLKNPAAIGAVRKALSDQGFKDVPIQSIGTDSRSFILRIRSIEGNAEAQIKQALNKGLEDNNTQIDSITSVGAEVGRDTTWNAIKAVLLSMLVLLIYIAVRFELKFGLGAIIALAHDLLAVMTFILITGEPFSLPVLASILAILGYSLNDTIVIFSKIRQNKGKYQGESEVSIANISINETLTRTLLTSISTFIAVAVILLMGGEALWGFSSVMLVGIVVGTYSSIYIASPVMLALGKALNR